MKHLTYILILFSLGCSTVPKENFKNKKQRIESNTSLINTGPTEGQSHEEWVVDRMEEFLRYQNEQFGANFHRFFAKVSPSYFNNIFTHYIEPYEIEIDSLKLKQEAMLVEIERLKTEISDTSSSPEIIPPVLAFPEANGFGKHATGGRGGTVIKVTNLNNSGVGSLRQALQYTSGARIIVFEVGGTITLTSVLSVTDGNVTVAGQTAPGGGILIKGSMVIIEDSNVIIRYIKFRPGPSAPANEPDGLSITAWGSDIVENIMIDHCSISWARDENFDIRVVSSGRVQNVTIQNSIISESGYGSLAGQNTYNKTYYKNLFAHNQDRNITTNYPTDGDFFDFEMINNLVYGCGSGPGLAWGSKHTILNNHFRESSQASIYNIICDYGSNGAGTLSESYAYISGNIIPNGKTLSASVMDPYIENTPYASSGIVPLDANLVANDILSHVGSSFPNRDAVDIRLINQYNAGSGALATSGTYPTISNGTPLTDTNNDGIPDVWDAANMGGETYNDLAPSGYTWIEEYINQLDK